MPQQILRLIGNSGSISGTVAPGFGPVLDAFTRNFTTGSETGASVCVYRNGAKVVDLWGGYADAQLTRPWEEDTIVCVMSVGKAIAAVCLHILIEQGRVELEAPVASYWPEFAANGKAAITVDQALSHLSGLIFPDAIPAGCLLEWEVATRAIASQATTFPPGARGSYHSSTYGYIIGEIAQRSSGEGFQELVRRYITAPFSADFHYGVPKDAQSRVAEFIAIPTNRTIVEIQGNGTSGISRAWRSMPKIPDVLNSPEWRGCVFPSANAHSNARGIARIFAALCGSGLDGAMLMKADHIRQMAQEQWFEECAVTGRKYRYARGVALTNPPYHPFGPNFEAFGHAGAGGALGFADPTIGLSFGYAMNRAGSGEGPDSRCSSLVDSVYVSLKSG